MTKISSLVTATAIASLLLMGAVSAQTTAPAKPETTKTETTKTEAPKAETKTEAKAPAAKKAERPRKPGSLECSKQADEKGVKGKERKKFRKACMKEIAEKEKAAGGAK
jgi:psiF repeat